MLTNEDIVRRYRKAQQTWKWSADKESWLRKLSDKLMYWKMPRIGSTELSDPYELSRRVSAADSIKYWVRETLPRDEWAEEYQRRIGNWGQMELGKAAFNDYVNWTSSRIDYWNALHKDTPVSDTTRSVNMMTPLNAIIPTPVGFMDWVSMPFKTARNLYNTAADMYNAWASERGAINQALIAEEDKWLLKEIADRIEAYQPEVVERHTIEPIRNLWK